MQASSYASFPDLVPRIYRALLRCSRFVGPPETKRCCSYRIHTADMNGQPAFTAAFSTRDVCGPWPEACSPVSPFPRKEHIAERCGMHQAQKSTPPRGRSL